MTLEQGIGRLGKTKKAPATLNQKPEQENKMKYEEAREMLKKLGLRLARPDEVCWRWVFKNPSGDIVTWWVTDAPA